ncbi:hypothetical protein [Candidatus Coxiella mudrowiae]|uniref:hypothetical protein n=1 Tax=Candidatus Coxiella mudrowiae TaxID=2054173 RepID=UPI000662BB85|nr:hypothetical protein [Candidatus Coxiella mudrowiae]
MFGCSLPTSVLNALAAVNAERAGGLQSTQYLIKLLNEASQRGVAYGAIILIASEAVLFFLNKRYFFDSGKAIIDLLKHVVLTSGSLLPYRNVREEDRVGLG